MSTFQDIISRVNEVKPNAFSDVIKMKWISELDGKIAADVFLMGIEEIRQLQCATDGIGRETLVDYPHDDIYDLWLEAKIDAANGEYNKYQNTMQLYNEAYSNFVLWFTRVYEPAQGPRGCGFAPRSDIQTYYLTAYGIALKRGFVGTVDEWLASLKGEQGLPGTDPKAIAAEVEKQLEPMEEEVKAVQQVWKDAQTQLSLCPEGASSNYYVFTPGWKRILVSMRHNSGIVNLSLDLNNKTYGRSMQSVTFGYSCAVVDHPSSKHNECRAGMPGAEPKLWQITNHCFGEDPSQSGLSRLFRIDKVRIAYPISWDETEDADTGDRYSNPINTYLDVHVVGEIPPTGVQLLTNIVAKSYNYGTMAVAVETPVQVSEDGYVLGIDDVKCHTHELRLWEEGMLDIPGESRFEGLAANRMDALVEKVVEVVPGERIGTKRVEIKSLDLSFDTGAGNGIDPTCVSLRAAYKENLLPGAHTHGYSNVPGTSGGVTATLLTNGIYRLNGTGTAITCRKIYEYREGDCPIKLLKGHTYYVYGAYIQVRHSMTATTWEYVRGFNNTTYQPELITYTPSEDKYIYYVGFYWNAGKIFKNVLVYPQLTEDPNLIVGDLNEGGDAHSAWLDYCAKHTAYGLPPLGYLAYLTRYVLPDVMYASQTLPLTSSASALHEAHISVENSYVLADGVTVDRCPSLPLYRRMLERADYIYAWQGGQDGSFCDSGRMVCVTRVPVVENGKLGDGFLDGMATEKYAEELVKEKALLLGGGEMKGALTTKGIYLTEGVDYFSEVPESVPAGKLIFVEAGG